MILALLRHGIAEDAGPDTDWRDEPRRLTNEGVERMRQAARGIAGLDLPAEVVLPSPLTRCTETAGLVADRLGMPVREHPALRPGMRIDPLIDLAGRVPRHRRADRVRASARPVVGGGRPHRSRRPSFGAVRWRSSEVDRLRHAGERSSASTLRAFCDGSVATTTDR